MQPDLLAEHLIVEQLSGRRGAVISRLALAGQTATAEQALEVIGRLSTRPDADPIVEGETLPIWVGRVTEALALAWPAHGNLLIFAAHEFGENLGRWVTDAWRSLDADAKSNLVDALELPEFATPLFELSAEVAEVRLSLAVTPQERAAALDQLNVWLSRLGGAENMASARNAAEEAVGIWSLLAAIPPHEHLSRLAQSLGNGATHLSSYGDAATRRLAVNFAERALEIDVNFDPADAEYWPRVALSQFSLANRLAALGDLSSRHRLLELARSAVETYRKLRRQSDFSDSFSHRLAMSLGSLSELLGQFGEIEERPEALQVAIKGLAVCQKHVVSNPAEYLPLRACLLQTVGYRLCER